MGRLSKAALRSRRNGAKAKAVVTLTEEQHTFFESAPALVSTALSGPSNEDGELILSFRRRLHICE